MSEKKADNTKFCPVCRTPYPAAETHCSCQRPATPLVEAPMIGKRLGNYIPFSLLGRGGMGEVYKARHVTLGQDWAVKTIILNSLQDPGVVERFKREAQLSSALKSDRIVKVIDFGETNDGTEDIYYMAMEFVAGETLGDCLAREKILPIDRALEIATQIGEALVVAHTHESIIIHRDLKPRNVMLLPGDRVKVLDFGLAKTLGATDEDWGKLTRTGSILGTLAYFSPEQARASKHIDQRSDLYSLALILYQMLTGRLPFEWREKNAGEILTERWSLSPVPIRKVLPTGGGPFPEALCDAVMQGLETDPEARFPSVRAFIDTICMSVGNPLKHIPQTASFLQRPTVSTDPDEQFWVDIKDTTDQRDFEAYLKNFPNGKYRPNAELRLRRLLESSSTQVHPAVVPQLPTLPDPMWNRVQPPPPLDQVIGRSFMDHLRTGRPGEKSFLTKYLVVFFAGIALTAGGFWVWNWILRETKSVSNPAPTQVPHESSIPKEPLPNTSKPNQILQVKGIPENRKVPAPADWETMADPVKGYEFQVPKETMHKVDTVDGVEIYVALTPKPSEVGIFITTFKDLKISRSDLLRVAEKMLLNIGEDDIRFGVLESLNSEYALVEGTSKDAERRKSKYKVLIVTKDTDNHILILGTDEDKFKTNRQMIDQIWSSFTLLEKE